MSEVATIEPVVATETEAPRSSEDPKIVSAVQAHLDAFDSLLEDGDTPPVEAAPAETPVSPDGETPVEGETPEETTETPTEEAAPAAPTADTTLPAAYHRTAKARGWTDQEIANFHKANPDLAIKTFERMHESRTKEINEWAELGRKSRGAAQPSAATSGAPAAASSPSPAIPQTGSSVLKPINVAEMVEKYGNQELIEALAGPLNAAIEAITPIIAETQQHREAARQTAQESLNKTIGDFFGGKEMKAFESVYGPASFAAKTPEQAKMVEKVLETADALIAGAAFQGRQLDVNEALVLAHDSVASGVKETVIRDAIRKDVTKRGKGITLKPTAQGRRAQGGAPRDRQELLARTEDRLAGAFA